MINLERVAYIEVGGEFEVTFYSDHQAELTRASFESEEQLRRYLEKLKAELPYPVSSADHERFPAPERAPLLKPAGRTEEGEWEE